MAVMKLADLTPHIPAAEASKPPKPSAVKTDASKPPKPKKDRPPLVIQIDDRDFRKMQDELPAVFTFWYCLQRIAFQKGHVFKTSFDVLRRETGMANKQISARTKILEGFGMLSVKRGKTSRIMNEYTMLAGVYKDHVRTDEHTPPKPEP